MKEPRRVVFISGVARSGTSWLGQIFDSCPSVRFRFQPLFSYEFKDKINFDSSGKNLEDFLNELHQNDSPFLVQLDKRKSGEYPVFGKETDTSDLVFKENRYLYLIEKMMRDCKRMKLIGIIRNPNAVLNSWMRNEKEFPLGSNPLEEWRFGDCKNSGHQDFFGYYKWKEASNIYLDLQDKYPDRVTVLKYEDLVANPLRITKELFEFSELEFTDQTRAFLEKSSVETVNSYYSVFKTKDVAEKWKEQFYPSITEEIRHDLSGTRLERFID